MGFGDKFNAHLISKGSPSLTVEEIEAYNKVWPEVVQKTVEDIPQIVEEILAIIKEMAQGKQITEGEIAQRARALVIRRDKERAEKARIALDTAPVEHKFSTTPSDDGGEGEAAQFYEAGDIEKGFSC